MARRLPQATGRHLLAMALLQAEGIDVDQPNFQRANGSHVIVDQADFTGEGHARTASGGEASLDASSIAAQRTSQNPSAT